MHTSTHAQADTNKVLYFHMSLAQNDIMMAFPSLKTFCNVQTDVILDLSNHMTVRLPCVEHQSTSHDHSVRLINTFTVPHQCNKKFFFTFL